MIGEFFSFFIPVVGIILGIFAVTLTISAALAYVIVGYRKWQIHRGMKLIEKQFEQLDRVWK